jgi:hypothetical protein
LFSSSFQDNLAHLKPKHLIQINAPRDGWSEYGDVLIDRGNDLMPKQIGLVSIVGLMGLLAAANAQTAPSAAGVTAFDGKYRLVSSVKVNDMYTAYNGQMGMCPVRKPGPLHIVEGRVHYAATTGYRFDGTVGPQGDLTMRSEMVGGSRPARMQASGAVDASGTVHVRQKGSSCSYDFVWQKQS